MKPNIKLLLAAAAAVGAALAVAQDKPPSSPPPPAPPPPAPAPASKPASTPAPGATPAPATAGHHEHFHHPEGGWQGGWHEGNRGPEGAEGSGHFQHPPLPPPKPVPYIGVVTAPVPPILASQLGLPESFGLVVEAVLPNSPAATAGLQRYDVLKLYNDQQIVDPRQLQILVRATGKDGSATLTVIRKAKEEKISVKIGEHTLAAAGHGFHHPDGAEQGAGHQRLAQAGAEQGGQHHPAPKPGEKPQGPGHQEFDHQRFAQQGGEHHGPEQQRFSRNGFEHHHSFDREGSQHRGFGHHGFGREGFGRESSHHGHHGFGHHGFDREGFGRQSSHHHGHHGFGHEGFDGQGSRHHGFDHHGCGREGFSRQSSHHHGFGHHGSSREGFDGHSSEHHGFHHRGFGHESFAGEDRQHSEHGPAHQGPGQFEGERQHAPFDRAGRQPERGPGPENRHHDFQNRPEGEHHRSSDVEQSPQLPPVDPADLLREIRPGGAAQVRVEHPEGSVVYDTANARVLFTDATGKIEIAVKDGHRTLLATNTQGETVFEGPIETPEQLGSVPEDIRKKIEWIESRTQTELVDAPAPAAPPKGELVQPELADVSIQ